MKIINDNGYKYLELSKNAFVSFVNEWSQLFGKFNWINWTFINIAFEDDVMLGGFEFDFVILGLGFHFRWNHTETETMKEMKKQADDIFKS